MTARGTTATNRHSTTRITIGASIQAEDSWACPAASLRGDPSKAIPARRAKTTAARPPIIASTPTASMAARHTLTASHSPIFIKLRYISHSPTNPFNGGSRRDGHGPDAIGGPRPGHSLHQPAQPFDVLGPRRMQHAPGRQEHQPLHQGVIPDVEQAGGHPQHGDHRLSAARPHNPTPRARPINPMFSMLE